jgi:hypothetical protein
MHRARTFDCTTLEYDWYHPRVRFVGVPKSSIQTLGGFEDSSQKLAELAASRAGHTLPSDDNLMFMPVHEMQIDNIRKRFHDAEILPPEVFLPALGQSSIRYDSELTGQ